MPFEMLKIAHREGIKVEYWNFAPPVEGIYVCIPNKAPIIGISKTLFECSPQFRCVLAEELGHHFTTVGDNLPKQFYHYRDRLTINKAEHRALKWAAEYLIPKKQLSKTLQNHHTLWDLAEIFNVTEEMMDFRLKMSDLY